MAAAADDAAKGERPRSGATRAISAASAAAVDAVDVAAYDLDGLRDDVRSIVDLRGAVGHMVRWALGVAVAVFLITMVAFWWRIDSSALTVVFAAATGAIALPLGAAIGAWRLSRVRLDAVTRASSRVIGVVGDMHTDVVEVRSGVAETSVQQVASGLLDKAVLPVVFDAVSGTAEGLLGPFGFLVKRLESGPRSLVRRVVIAAVDSMPDRVLGEIAPSVDPDRLAELTEAVRSNYDSIIERLTGIATRVARASFTVGLSAVALTLVPVVIWLVLGLVVS